MFLLVIGFLLYSSFSLAFEIYVILFSGLHGFWEIYHSNCFLIYVRCHMSWAAFWIFSLSLVFRSLINVLAFICLGFWIHLYEFCSALYRFKPLAKVGRFWTICLNAFLALPLLFGTPLKPVWHLLLSHGSLGLLCFLSGLFSLVYIDKLLLLLAFNLWFFPLSLPFCCRAHPLHVFFGYFVF